MTIELPRQPHDGRPRHCYKCKASFVPVPEHRNARQCPGCRANPTKPRVYPEASKAATTGHTHAWDSRSLGLFEAAILRTVWRPDPGPFVTGDSE